MFERLVLPPETDVTSYEPTAEMYEIVARASAALIEAAEQRDQP